MRILFAAIMIAVLAGPTYAQDKPVPRYGDTDKEKSPQEKQAERDAEKAYQRSLGNIPTQAGSNDPWGAMRSDSPPKPAAAAPTTKKAKTTSGTTPQKPQ
ncbi:MAG TPA: hypothetical protein VE567_07670 [Sphingomonas sp.]|nr:hypothetical protein [Sphingomonas sp.]